MSVRTNRVAYLALLLAGVTAATAGSDVITARDGAVEVVLDRTVLAPLNLQVEGWEHGMPRGGTTAPPLVSAMDGHAESALDRGHIRAPRDVELGIAPLRFSRGSATFTASGIREAAGGGTVLEVVDGADTPLLRLTELHYKLDWPTRRLLIEDADVSLTAVAASRLGIPDAAGIVIGVAHLRMPMATLREPPAHACQSPRWPSASRRVDVALAAIDGLQLDCASGDCARRDAGRLKVTPTVALENVGTADVPWFTQFVPGDHAYPYRGSDQHPYLVWNLYRVDAGRRLRQIGRSGLKHAVVTVNSGCACGDPHILGVGCGDVYGKSSNDNNVDLGPRREVIPHTGRWARCGSFRDRDCDGERDAALLTDLGERLVVPVSALRADDAESRLYVEAGYIVRDDVDLDNSFGHRGVRASWTPQLWLASLDGDLKPGFVFDAWLETLPDSVRKHASSIETRDGSFRVASTVTRLENGKRRFRYVVMNRDYAVTTTTGDEPNLRLVGHHGLSGFFVRKDDAPAAAKFFDADADPGNDWLQSVSDRRVQWKSSGSNELTWGTLFSFEVEIDAEAAMGSVDVLSGSGVHRVEALVPERSAPAPRAHGSE